MEWILKPNYLIAIFLSWSVAELFLTRLFRSSILTEQLRTVSLWNFSVILSFCWVTSQLLGWPISCSNIALTLLNLNGLGNISNCVYCSKHNNWETCSTSKCLGVLGKSVNGFNNLGDMMDFSLEKKKACEKLTLQKQRCTQKLNLVIFNI